MSESQRHVRGDVPQYGRPPVLDRRQWARREVPRIEASLSWMRRGEMMTIEARVVDLSLGGAGVLVQTVPPRDALLRLALASDAAVRVDGRAIGMRPHPKPGWLVLRLQFQTECPRGFWERAPGGADDEADGS